MNLQELEALRKKCLYTYIVIMVIAVAITIGVLIYDYSLFVFALLPIIVGFVLATYLTNNSRKEYALAYKDVFVKKALEEVFDDLTYKPDCGIPYEVIEGTRMIYMGDEYSSNDYVSGYYKGIGVEQADVHIQEMDVTTDSDGGSTTTYQTIFMGRWLIFDFNRDFKANIQVKDKWFMNAKLGSFFKDEGYQKVKMDDPDFDKMFRVSAQDEHAASSLLTPSLMEKMITLKQNVKGRLMFCFIDDKLHIAVSNNKDSFEPSIFKKINPDVETYKINGDIKLITDFIDGLSLEKNLFE